VSEGRVISGVGISGGSGGSGGSGDVATDAIWDAKGDLAGGTGADTAVRLAVGADNTVLTADAAATTGMKWAAAGAGSESASNNVLRFERFY